MQAGHGYKENSEMTSEHTVIFAKKDFDVSNMGICAITSHENGKKHVKAMRRASENCQIRLLKMSVSTIQTNNNELNSAVEQSGVTIPDVGSTASSSTVSETQRSVDGPANSVPATVQATMEVLTSKSCRSTQSTLDNRLIKDDVTRAEIIWALNGVMCHSSLRGNANSASLFAQMFPDSDIASRFQMQKDKNSYVVTYGLGPYFQEMLSSTVQKCPFFAISFDESLNKVSQKGQMDIVVRFWNDATDEVTTRYLTSTFLGHASSQDLLTAFTSALGQQNLNLKKMQQVSMDGPNVNLKFLRELKTYLTNASDPNDVELFDIGTCSLHVVHGAYKTAHNACGWKVNIFIRSLYYLFKDFPSRRSDYTNASNSCLFPLRFCSIRWVENSSVIKRALEIIPFLKLYVAAVAKKPPDSKNFKKVKVALDEKDLIAKLGFLQSVALQLEPFLIKYQSNKPLLPFMSTDVYTLLRNLMVRFVKADVMAGVTNANKLMEVEFMKKENQITLHNIDVGFAATAACKDLTGVEVLRFKEECCTFLKHVCMKLTAKCPLKYRLVTGASCLDPQVMLNEMQSLSRVTTALEVFVEKKHMEPSVADIVKREYSGLCKKTNVRSMLKTFKPDKDRLDEFLTRVLDLGNENASLKKFIHQILTMFHGNAAVERSFSINKECLVENLLDDSLVAQRVVHDAVSSAGGVTAVPIPKALIHAVRNASAKRLEAAKKKTEAEDAAANHRKRVAEEIKLLEAKKARVEQASKEETLALNDELRKLRNALKK